MPPLPTIANTFRVAMHWNGAGGQSAVNVMHFFSTTLSIRNVAVALDANVTATMWAQTAASASVGSLFTTKLDGTSATDVLAVSGAKWTGSGGALDHIPAGAQIISLRTGFRGRSRRGRVFLPFISEGAQVNGIITAPVGAQQTAWNTFLTAMTTAGALPVVASYKLIDQEPVTSYLVETVLGTQRRRQSRLR